MDKLFQRLEERARGPTATYRLLGVSKNKYYEYRRGVQLPHYIEASMQAHLALSDEDFQRLLHACLACKALAEHWQAKDNDNRRDIVCASCGSYDISKNAIRRIKKHPSEYKRFLSRLAKARTACRKLMITVEPGSGLVFKTRKIGS